MKTENSAPLQNILGFRVLPVILPSANIKIIGFKEMQKIDQCAPKDMNIEHNIYFKKHDARNDEKFPIGRTLFLSNIPANTSIEHIKTLFSAQGEVENVFWRIKADALDIAESADTFLKSTGSTCHVVFTEASAVDSCMSMKSQSRFWTHSEDSDDSHQLLQPSGNFYFSRFNV